MMSDIVSLLGNSDSPFPSQLDSRTKYSSTLYLFQRKCGVIVYDDLNHPHMVEADQEILAQYSTPTTMKNRRGEFLKSDYQTATMSTFSLASPPGVSSPPGSVLGIRSPLPETPGIHQVAFEEKHLSILVKMMIKMMITMICRPDLATTNRR